MGSRVIDSKRAIRTGVVLLALLGAEACVQGELPLEFLDVAAIDPAECEEPAPFAEVTAIFERSCAHIPTCHGDASGVVVLTAEVAHARLVDQPSNQSAKPLVAPGAPDDSYLVDKLLGRDGASLMPPQGPLSEDEVRAVACWIAQGAAP